MVEFCLDNCFRKPEATNAWHLFQFKQQNRPSSLIFVIDCGFGTFFIIVLLTFCNTRWKCIRFVQKFRTFRNFFMIATQNYFHSFLGRHKWHILLVLFFIVIQIGSRRIYWEMITYYAYTMFRLRTPAQYVIMVRCVRYDWRQWTDEIKANRKLKTKVNKTGEVKGFEILLLSCQSENSQHTFIFLVWMIHATMSNVWTKTPNEGKNILNQVTCPVCESSLRRCHGMDELILM